MCLLAGGCGRLDFDALGDGAVGATPGGLLVNGSFEADYDGWTHTGNQSIQISGQLNYQASDGTHLNSFNDGNTTPDAVLSQSFAATPGGTYTLSFDLGLLAFSGSPQSVRVEITGAAVVYTEDFTLVRTTTNLRWDPTITRTFTGDSATLTLTFYDTSTATTAVDLLLDRVAVAPL